MNIRISVITPSFNQANFIERTIESVLTQNIANLEYVVIDGGSTDDTVNILKKYNSSIKWTSEQDNGQTHAVNKGIHSTSGNIIAWLNSDDIYYPGTLQYVCDYFDSNPNIDIIYGDANHIDTQDNIIEKYYTEHWNIERLKEVCYLCQPAVFFRRSVIHRFGMLNENLQYCMDYEYWLRLANNGAQFAYLPKILAGSRLHADTKTLGSRIKVHAEINDMLKSLFKCVPDRWLSNYAHVYVESTYPNYTAKKLTRAIAIKTLLASLYWNKKISKPLMLSALRWFFHTFNFKKR